MIILGIETSCDETAAAVVQNIGKRVKVLSNVVASSAKLQAKYGGVIPEQAAREQIKSIIPVIKEALKQALPKSGLPRRFAPRNDENEIDAIAVTYGPGLIGSLLVGVETAKILATVWKKPLIPVNHLIGHFYANWISPSSLRDHEVAKQSPTSNNKIATSPTAPRNDSFKEPQFPCLGLLISGGHTDLVLFKDHGKYEYIGGTRDDAAGECFDKCARLLGLPYPGGPEISKLAAKGNAAKLNLPRPMIDSKDFDFSFSGLKTAVANFLKEAKFEPVKANGKVERTTLPRIQELPGAKQTISEPSGEASGALRSNKPTISDLATAIEQAIIDVLITKTIQATQKYKVQEIIVAGGVAANQKLASELKLKISNLKFRINLHIPDASLCTDNAAMIATTALFNYQPINPLTLQADPNLSLSKPL